MKIRAKSRSSSTSAAVWINKRFIPLVSGAVGSVLLFWFYGAWVVLQDDRTSSMKGAQYHHLSHTSNKNPFCAFRRYPPHRYYDLKEPLDFLINDDYIYGEWPVQLNPSPSLPETKLCVDQSEWLPTSSNSQVIWPFADGTNPSILSLQRIRDRGAGEFADQVQKLFGSTAAWVTTICMTNSQCTWKDNEEMRAKFDLPDLQQTTPNTVRTLLHVYTKDFSTVLGAQTIYLHRDASWGKKHRNADNSWQLPALDDARLFLHDSRVYVSFREGPGFGYENQVLHPLHIEADRAYIRASESSSMCCGRNMALIDDGEDGQLKALTWVDPVTIEDVDATPGHHARPKRKTKEERQKAPKIKKSHIHGTNGYMIPVSDTELLGVAHFHRPNDRNQNPYARFGHHYTHAFYLVSRDGQLKSLSPEFLLTGTEIIQFISGLEFDGTTITLAYGINDCEAAVVQLDWALHVQPLLRKVAEGQQVIDLMAPLTNGPRAVSA